MSEPTTSRKTRWLLAALLLIWVGVSVNAVLALEEEGADVCDRLAYRFEKYPGDERPCRVSQVRSDGEHILTIRGSFDDDELALVEFDGDGDGAYDQALDCSWSGRVAMPVLHTGRWLGVAVSKEMMKGVPGLEFVERRSEPDGDQTVVFFESARDAGGQAHRRRDRRNAKDQLVERRIYQGSYEPPIRTLVLTYDDRGRVETVWRRTEMPKAESMTRLAYQCGSPGR